MEGLAVTCPQCHSNRVYRDGLRYSAIGEPIQRFLCRECGFRFSLGNFNKECWTNNNRQICVLAKKAKNLAIATENVSVAVGEKTTSVEKGKIVEFLWQLKREGCTEKTILNNKQFMNWLFKKGANLLDGNSVKDIIAQQETWSTATKHQIVTCYKKFAALNQIPFEKPHYKHTSKLPFIPTEQEIDQLIASCGKKTSAMLQLLKETGIRLVRLCVLNG